MFEFSKAHLKNLADDALSGRVSATLSTLARIFIVGGLVSAFCVGCVTPQNSATRRLSKPFLWQISESSDNFVLFGTIHSGVDAKLELPREVWEAIRSRPCFVAETNLDQISKIDMTVYTELPKGQSLKAKVSAETWRYLVHRLSDRVSMHTLQRMRPWAVLMRLYAADSATHMNAVMDVTLTKYAREQGKKILFFETLQDQLETIDRVFTEADIEDYRRLGAENLQVYTDQLLKWYRAGDEGKIAQIIASPVPGAGNRPEQLEYLLYERNRKWLDILRNNSEYRQCFIAVGVGHLIGPKGMVAAYSR